MSEPLAKARKALEEIEHCNGYCPDHIGDSVELAKEIIESLRNTARIALKEIGHE